MTPSAIASDTSRPARTPSVEKAAENRQCFSLHQQPGGTIVATAAVFDYEDGAPFVELSDTLVAESFGGYGLQKLLFRLRVASVIVTQGTDVAITTAVMPENGDSVANIQKAGFLPWGSPIPSAHASCPACPHQPRARSLSPMLL
jgi:hypothetical protein